MEAEKECSNYACGCSPVYDPPVERLNADSCFSLGEMDDEHEAFSSAALLLNDCYLHT